MWNMIKNYQLRNNPVFADSQFIEDDLFLIIMLRFILLIIRMFTTLQQWCERLRKDMRRSWWLGKFIYQLIHWLHTMGITKRASIFHLIFSFWPYHGSGWKSHERRSNIKVHTRRLATQLSTSRSWHTPDFKTHGNIIGKACCQAITCAPGCFSAILTWSD